MSEFTDETIDVPGLGSVPSPSELAAQKRSKYETDHVGVPDQCPVQGCTANGFHTFAQLRGHFGSAGDGAHRSYDLRIDDYREEDE